MRKIDPPKGMKAEGRCCGFPYNTELASSEGVWFHVWLGDAPEATAPLLERAARRQRDVVRFTYSGGQPDAFWAHQDFGSPVAGAPPSA